MCCLADDVYAKQYVKENFKVIAASCLSCGGRVMYNVHAPYLDEYGCTGCDKFWDSCNSGEMFNKPRQCRPAIPY
jgi:hypothetical protein